MQTIPTLESLLGQKKEREYVTLVVILAALWLVLWITGCAKNTQTSTTDSTANTGTTATAESTANNNQPGTPASGTATAANGGTASNGNLTDANIIAKLSEADSAEISEAKLVLMKTKNPQVRSFAQMMIADHSKMKSEKAELAKKMNITPQPPAGDNTPQEMTSEMSALNSASNPQALDSIYINDAVQDHTNDLAEVRQLETTAPSPELRDAIKKAEPVIAKHLDHAKMVQSRLSKTSMASGKKTR